MSEPTRRRPTRRKFIRTVAAAGAVAAAHQTFAASATTATSAPAALPPREIADALNAIGRDFTPAEHQMMSEGLTARRELYQSLRRRKIDPRIEPAIQFNPRVPGVKYPFGSSSFKLSDGPLPDYSGDINSLAFASTADLSRLIHAKKITSVELTTMYLARLDKIGRRLNAVVTLTSDLALAQAKKADEDLAAGKDRGPLHGIPYGAKDLLATKGIPTTFGVKIFEDQIFDYDATVIERLEAAGAVLCAKLSLGELAMGDVWFGGRTNCPWNESEGSSGSSAGPCATVAAGCVAFAIGSETMGSIISPCLTNGTTGLRPTYGRVSRYGAMALSRTMDKLGPITRSVEDCAMILSAIHGPDDRDPTAAAHMAFNWDPTSDVKKLRIGYDVAAFDQLFKSKNAAKREALQTAMAKIKELAGADLTPIHLPPTEPYAGIVSLFIAAEAASNFNDLLESGHVRDLVQQDAGSWPNTFRKGTLIPASDYLRAMQVRSELMRAMHDAMKDVDLYVTIPYSGPTIAFTNVTGHPSLVTRCGMVDNRPVFLEFLAQPYREDAALRLAFAYEQANDWTKNWPAVR